VIFLLCKSLLADIILSHQVIFSSENGFGILFPNPQMAEMMGFLANGIVYASHTFGAQSRQDIFTRVCLNDPKRESLAVIAQKNRSLGVWKHFHKISSISNSTK
jgi:hypothetical protein